MTSRQLLLAVAPDAHFTTLPAIRGQLKGFSTPESIAKALDGLDMELMPAVEVPTKFSLLERPGLEKFEALADNGGVQVRLRSSEAKEVVNAAYRELPSAGQFSKAAVGEVMKNKIQVDAGTKATLGRVMMAYPKRGAGAPAEPVTKVEAFTAIRNCGVEMAGRLAGALRPYPLVPVDGVDNIKVNPHSDNGYPVLRQWSTPGAPEKVYGLATTLHREVQEAYRRGGVEGVVCWKREKEATHPWLVALKGKAKADYYTVEKLEKLRLRFYNVIPRQIMLIMQTATQPFELNATHILNSDSRSGIGITLTHGGADELIAALDRQLDQARREGRLELACVHVGDDSFVAVREGAEVVLFALDCSNFDLTQHHDVTAEIHRAEYEQLRLVDGPAAALWYAYARERVVVVAGTVVRRWKHAGPSGMPLQSKTNDLLMDVALQRVEARWRCGMTEAETDEFLQGIGEAMGLAIRVEQYQRIGAASIRAALRQTSFLFIGYYFHNKWGDDVVRVHADIARTFSQVPYPSGKWAHSKGELTVKEAMRLGSIAMGLGQPCPETKGAIDAFRAAAQELVQEALKKGGPHLESPMLRWAVQENPWGPQVAPSLKGLLTAMQRPAEKLWETREPELEGTSTMLASWAEEVESSERLEAAMEGSVVDRPAGRSVRGTYIPHAAAPTHPATARNDGRPPPTAVWGPDKPKRDQDRQIRLAGLAARGRERRNAFAVYDGESSTDSDWGMDYADLDDGSDV